MSLRHQLVLGKYPVIEINRGVSSQSLVLAVEGKLFIRTQVPLTADIKVGDLLTLYTEVLAQQARS